MNRKLQVFHLFLSVITFLLVMILFTGKEKTLFDFNKSVSKRTIVPSIELSNTKAIKITPEVSTKDHVYFEIYNGSISTIYQYWAEITALDEKQNILWKRKTKGTPWNSTSIRISPYSSKQVCFYYSNINVFLIEAKIVEYEID